MTALPPASGAAPQPTSTITGMADQPAPVRLYHPTAPSGRDFDPVTARTMRRQGWTDGTDQAPSADEAPQLDGLPDPPTTSTPTGPDPEATTTDTLNPEATDG